MRWALWFIKRLVITDHREIVHMSKGDQNAILVVSVLIIATATYQAILSSPDKDKFKCFNMYFITYDIFRYSNTLAFGESMMEICIHLPFWDWLHSPFGSPSCYMLCIVDAFLVVIFYWSYYSLGCFWS